MVVWVENIIIKHLPSTGFSLNQIGRKKKIVVSLTTFPGRINECALSLKTIFKQTMLPDRIVLWLAESQFPDHILPRDFDALVASGLEIRYVDDLRSHKKYFYMLQEQKEDELVITFDDDIIYHPRTIERAYRKHLEFPNAIVCNEVKYIMTDKAGNIDTYSKWGHPGDCYKIPDIHYSVMSGSGTLYPYGIFPKDIFNWELIKSTSYLADDLWITMMAKYYNIPVVGTDIAARVYTTIIDSQSFSLGQENCIGTGNDDTIRNILKLFPSIKDKLT